MYIIIGIIAGIIVTIILFNLIANKINAPREKLRNELYVQKKNNSKLEKIIAELKDEIEFLKKGISEKDELFNDLKSFNNLSVNKINSLISDFHLLQFDISSKYLRTKKHPAFEEAKRIIELKEVSKEYLMELNLLKYKYELLESVFPELSNHIKDIESIKYLNDDYGLKALHQINELKTIISLKEEKINNYENEIKFLEQKIIQKDELYKTINQNNPIFKISTLYADFLLLQYELSIKFLQTKDKPAIKEALRIEELKKESKTYIEQYKQMMYRYEMLLQLFPELTNYVEDIETIKELEKFDTLKSLQEDYDRVQFYLTKEEYSELTTDERNQLALDRYIKGQKTKWQIGRDYELYCGLLYEKDNWDVEYIGMEKKLGDMGRDLIAIKGDIHHVIQCKYWSQDKVIHEKHITQLFGTAIEYGMDLPENITIKPVFMTNIQLSDSAKRFAKKLGVIVNENVPFQEFPRIKCNVNRDEYGYESLIYHLPFDQQYDRTKINKKNEFYAFTVKEAVKAGFRRAFKYFG